MELKPGYRRTEMGAIPEHWEVAPLDDFISFISYGFTNPMPTARSGVFMVTAKDINNGRIEYETTRCTTEQAYNKLLTAKSRPQRSDLLLTKDGTLGRLALVDDRRICINQSVAILRPNAKVTPSFLKILLEAAPYQRKMLEEAGGSTIKHIYITIVNRMPIAVPADRSEQDGIASALSDIDALISSLDLLIAKKRDIKQATMQQLLTGKQRLLGFSGKWVEKPLGELADVVMGQSPSSSHYNLKREGLPLVQGNADIKDRHAIERVYTREITKRGLPGDILLSVRAPVGEVARTTFEICLGRGVCALRSTNDFLYHALVYQEPMWARFSSGSTFDSVNSIQVKSFKLPIPTDNGEQIAIASVLSDMDAEIAALVKKRDKTRNLKQGMMQELLTGRIRLI